MKIIYAFLFGLLFINPGRSGAQAVYDSLRQVYNEAYLFNKYYNNKRNVSFEAAIHYELRTIWNDSIRDLAVVSVYENAYGYNWTDSTSLNYEIDSIINKTLYPEIRQHAMIIKERANIPLVGRNISRMGLPDVNGDTLWLESFRGENFIVNLFAAWNATSIKDMKKITELTNKYKVSFCSISLDEEYQDMVRFINQKGYHWPIVFAGLGSDTQFFYNVRHLPKYIFVNSEGEIIADSYESIEAAVRASR